MGSENVWRSDPKGSSSPRDGAVLHPHMLVPRGSTEQSLEPWAGGKET